MREYIIISLAVLLLLYSFAITGRFFYLRGYEDGKQDKASIYEN